MLQVLYCFSLYQNCFHVTLALKFYLLELFENLFTFSEYDKTGFQKPHTLLKTLCKFHLDLTMLPDNVNFSDKVPVLNTEWKGNNGNRKFFCSH